MSALQEIIFRKQMKMYLDPDEEKLLERAEVKRNKSLVSRLLSLRGLSVIEPRKGRSRAESRKKSKSKSKSPKKHKSRPVIFRNLTVRPGGKYREFIEKHNPGVIYEFLSPEEKQYFAQKSWYKQRKTKN
jgi:hypothetical protein